MTNPMQEVNMDDDEIEGLFKPGEFEEDEETTDVETEETEDKGEETEDDSTESETSEDSKEDSEDTEPPAESKTVPIAALLDERRKAKQYKEENERLKAQLPKSEDEPDPVDDPEAWKQWQRNQMQVEERERQKAEWTHRVDESRGKMLESHTDYSEMEELFYILASKDPSLNEEMYRSMDPAKFAYDKATEYQKGYDAKREAAIRQNILDEGYVLSEGKPKPKSDVPNLAKVSASGKNSVDVEDPNFDVDDMFADQEY